MTAAGKSRVGWLAMAFGLLALAAAPELGAERSWPSSLELQAGSSALESLEFRSLEDAFSRGGRSTAVTGVPSDPDRYYMGSTGGGVWTTTDAGASWTNISDGYFEAGSIGAICVADSNPDVIYVGTGSACPRGNVSPGIGMYKTTDGGKTWRHVGLRSAGQIGRVRVHPSNPDLVYVAVLGNMFGPSPERGVYRSRDGGATWEQVLAISDRTGAVDLTMDPKNPNVLIAAMWTVERKPWSIDSGSTEGGLYKTTDGGNNWRKLTRGLPTNVMVGRIGVSISGADSSRVYAQVEAGGDQGGTFRSDDGGETWTRTFTGRNLQQRAFYYTHIYADPKDVDTVYGLNTGALKSTDGGKTFQSAGVQSHGDYHDIWVNPNDNTKIIVANDGGAGITTGQGWSPQDNQPTAELYRLTVDNRWPYWVYGAQQDNSTIAVPSQGPGEPYGVGGGESGHIAVDPRDPNVVYAGNYGGTISRQDRGRGLGENVRVYADMQTGQRAADMKYRFQWNAPIRISPHNPDVVYTTSQHVHRTTNAGVDWEVISPDLTRNDKRRQDYSGGEGITRDSTGVEVYSTIFAFEESPAQAGLLWAGSDDGLVHISRDNGRTWTNITPPGAPEGVVNVIDLSAHNPGRAHIAMYRYRQADFTPYIYQTNDYGATWRRIADGRNGIPDWHFVRVVREDPVRRGLLFAGTEFGLYASYDDGASWQRFQLNLPATPVTDMQIYRDDLIVTTQGRSFWILDNMSVVRGIRPDGDSAARLFPPETAYRSGGPQPAFYYWFREQPTAPVNIEVRDAQNEVRWTFSAQPGTASPPETITTGGAGRGGRGARGGGGGGRGGRGGRGGFGAGPQGGAAGAQQGLNRAVWTSLNLPAPYEVPDGIVMWGGGRGSGPSVPPGTYTVTVSSGAWSESQPFRLNTDPRYEPVMSDEEGAEQLRLALEVGGMVKDLYDNLARIRDVKAQARSHADKAGASSPVAAATRTLVERLEAVEGDMTQMQGEGGQDALNFPGRMDNQLIALYQNISGRERRIGSPIRERYMDLKPEADQLMAKARQALQDDVAAFNRVATAAGLPAIVVR
jgi:photosystem II stability/assembly factor-like uncharacterized protein